MFRIVKEIKGESTVGFRVQKFGTRFNGDSKYEDYWHNRGRRVYSLSDAKELMTLLDRQENMANPPATYEEITG